jgi:pyruvate-ferredoxin/flavodoxin oxidoreductase
MRYGMNQQKLAVNAGVWPIYRYNPTTEDEGRILSNWITKSFLPVKEFAYNETRYKMLVQSNEERAEELMKHAEKDALSRWQFYSQMAAMDYSQPTAE